jgi:hypothetical protein
VSTTREQSRARLPVADLLLTAGLAGLFAAAFLVARDWSFNAGFFPRLITTFGLALAVLHLLVLLVRRRAPETHPHTGDEEGESVDVEYVFEHASRSEWAQSLAWLSGFFLSLYLIGLFVTAPLFAVAYLRTSAGSSWKVSVTYALVVGLTLYAAFEWLLGLPVPSGALV